MEFPSPVCFRSKTVQSYFSSWYKVEGLLFSVESQKILLYFDRVMILTFTMVELCLHCTSRVRPWRTIDGPLLGLFVTCSGLKYEQRAHNMNRSKLLDSARCARRFQNDSIRNTSSPFRKICRALIKKYLNGNDYALPYPQWLVIMKPVKLVWINKLSRLITETYNSRLK